MTRDRDIVAESIGDLLDLARLQRRSGLLGIERSQGTNLEEGELYLLMGQPIYARVGELFGEEALHYLLNWRNVRFSFTVDVPRPQANIFSTARVSSVPAASGAAASVPAHYPVTGGLRWSVAEEEGNDSSPSAKGRPAPTRAWLRPQKIGLERNAHSLSLSRRQRLIYFLVDGSRTVADLARTTGKTVVEVEFVLNELEEQGLVMF